MKCVRSVCVGGGQKVLSRCSFHTISHVIRKPKNFSSLGNYICFTFPLLRTATFTAIIRLPAFIYTPIHISSSAIRPEKCKVKEELFPYFSNHKFPRIEFLSSFFSIHRVVNNFKSLATAIYFNKIMSNYKQETKNTFCKNSALVDPENGPQSLPSDSKLNEMCESFLYKTRIFISIGKQDFYSKLKGARSGNPREGFCAFIPNCFEVRCKKNE